MARLAARRRRHLPRARVDAASGGSRKLWRYDHYVTEPRLGASIGRGRPSRPASDALLAAAARPTGSTSTGPALAYYRDGRDALGAHRDRELRYTSDTLVAILTFGSRRPWQLTPLRAGAGSAQPDPRRAAGRRRPAARGRRPVRARRPRPGRLAARRAAGPRPAHRPHLGAVALDLPHRPTRARPRLPRAPQLLPRASRGCAAGPGEQVVRGPGVDDRLRRDAAGGGPLAAAGLPFQLAGRVGVGVDADAAAGLHRQPQQPLRRIQPFGTGVDLDRDPELGAGREDDLGVELRLGPPALPTTMRPVQCPSTSTCGLAMARTIRGVISSAGIRSLECTDATTTSSSASSSGSWSSVPSSRMSTSMPVSSRNGASSAFTSATTSSCSTQPLGGQARWRPSAAASGRSAPCTRARARRRRGPSPRSVSRRRTSRCGCAGRPSARAQLWRRLRRPGCRPVASSRRR